MKKIKTRNTTNNEIKLEESDNESAESDDPDKFNKSDEENNID